MSRPPASQTHVPQRLRKAQRRSSATEGTENTETRKPQMDGNERRYGPCHSCAEPALDLIGGRNPGSSTTKHAKKSIKAVFDREIREPREKGQEIVRRSCHCEQSAAIPRFHRFRVGKSAKIGETCHCERSAAICGYFFLNHECHECHEFEQRAPFIRAIRVIRCF
jgi:hypothetical protein